MGDAAGGGEAGGSRSDTLPDAGCLRANTVAALLDGRLEGGARTRAESHLAACETCRDLVDGLASRVEVLKTATTRLTGAPTVVDGAAGPNEDTLEPGALVDHYRVVRLLGRGGMGEVYLARDLRLERNVALKIVSPAIVGSPRAFGRFMREARTTARLNHPNIVTVHTVGEHGTSPYLALEYVEGVTLRRWMAERPRDRKDQLRVALGIAEALVEAHRAGVLHRDLKPENVLIGANGRVRVVDFGIAETIAVEPGGEAPTSTREIGPIVTGLAGTPRYMAPEQWGEAQRTGATDVWALGTILYELIAGRHPVGQPGSLTELAATVCCAEAMPALPEGDETPEKLRALVARCLRKSPAERPSADEVAAELRRVLETRALPSRPVSAVRRRGVQAVTVALTVAAAAAGAWLLARRPGGAPAGSRTTAADPTATAVASPAVSAPAASPAEHAGARASAALAPEGPASAGKPEGAPSGPARAALGVPRSRTIASAGEPSSAPPGSSRPDQAAPSAPSASPSGDILRQW